MLNDLEKNDVDISKLFEWGQKFTLMDKNNDPLMDIYMRLVGDADWNRARIQALRASTELRKKLRDPESDETLAFLPDYESVSKERIIDLLIAINIRSLTDKVILDLKVKVPTEPRSDASLEEQEKYQEEIDNYPKQREHQTQEKLKLEIKKEQDKFIKLSKKELETNYTIILVNSMCELEMGKVFYDVCTFNGTFKDENYTTKLFSSYNDFLNASSNIKEQLIQFYRNLELGINDLKK